MFMLVTAALLYWLIRHQTTRILKNEELYRLLAENTVDMIWIFDVNTQRFTYVSPTVEKIRGYTSAEVMNQTLAEAFTLESARYVEQVLPERLAEFQSGIVKSYIDQIDQPCKNGATAYTEATTFFFTNPKNEHLEIYGVARDISERRQAEAALRQQHKQLLSFIEQAPLSIAMFDKSMNYLATSRRWIIEYGRGYTDLIGRNHYEVHPDLPEYWKDAHRKGLAGESLQNNDDLWIQADGQKNWLRWAITPWTDENGDIGGIIISAEDITERKRAEESLRQSQDNFARAFNSNPAALTVTRLADGKFISINESYTKMMGYEPAEILGRTVADLNIYVNQDERNQLLQQLREQGRVRNYELLVRNKTAETHSLVVSMEPILYDHEDCILSTFIDITDRKLIENELRRSNSELEQFAYVASHDLQEPLRGVAGMVQLLRQRYQGQLDERADEYIALAVEASERMQKLINDLLDYSRVDRFGKPFESISLENCLKIALANLQMSIKESQAQITYDPLPTVKADPAQITQVLQNLIGNAIKFRGERSPQIQISAVKAGEFWQIEIHDNGLGIESKYFERIFMVFQRLYTRREFPGTGIGLSICKKIIERHQGQIWVESQPGQGSTFYFTLPEKNS
jgi:PAS domain S-box-containing protein